MVLASASHLDENPSCHVCHISGRISCLLTQHSSANTVLGSWSLVAREVLSSSRNKVTLCLLVFYRVQL